MSKQKKSAKDLAFEKRLGQERHRHNKEIQYWKNGYDMMYIEKMDTLAQMEEMQKEIDILKAENEELRELVGLNPELLDKMLGGHDNVQKIADALCAIGNPNYLHKIGGNY